MADFLEEFMANHGSEVSQQLSSHLGVDKKTAMQIIPQVVPLVMGGLKKQMDGGGADRANYILNKHGNASALDHIGSIFSTAEKEENPDPGLGGLLGASGTQASNTLANNFKLDPSMAMKIIPMLAPIILGALTKKRDTTGIGSGGIASLIDKNGDGNILDDVAGFFTGALGGGGNKSGGGDDLLGSVLGGFLGKK